MSHASYAADPTESRGRLYPVEPSPTRTEYQRDRDRVIHSTAFRRLKEKTQVFLFDEGDHFRTRLTHTLEVSQIARALAAAMADHGGFDHNAQSLRVVTELERRYPGYDGLNLTWETLEGIVKHNGPLAAPFPYAIAAYNARHDLMLSTHAGGEAQAAAIADDIAYDTHDIDDGLRAGLLSLDGLDDLPLVGDILRAIRTEYPGLAVERMRAELVRRLITVMVEDVITESRRRIAELAPQSADAIRTLGRTLIGFSAGIAAADGAIKARLRHDVYRHAEVMDVMGRAEAVVGRLFRRYREDPSALPEGWRPAPGADEARVIADFLAGMTDRYALLEHQRFFGGPAELR